MRHLRLYHRSGCHLCEAMVEELQELGQSRVFILELIDIDADASLSAAYGSRIPVLLSAEDDCLAECRLDQDVLLTYLDGG